MLRNSKKKAADLYNLGCAYYDKKEYGQAFPCFLKAARYGHKDAQFKLVTCYAEGLGVKQNFKKSEKWLRKADPRVIIDIDPPDDIKKQYAKLAVQENKEENK